MEKAHKDTLKGCLILLLVFGIGLYGCFRKNNEVGFLGMDKYGRQVFIQTLTHYSDPGLEAASEWDDTFFLQRVLQEPMRTTLKIKLQSSGLEAVLEKGDWATYMDEWLEMDALWLFGEGARLILQKDLEIGYDELEEACETKGIESFRLLLAGFGFKRIQLFVDGEFIQELELPSKNVTWRG